MACSSSTTTRRVEAMTVPTRGKGRRGRAAGLGRARSLAPGTRLYSMDESGPATLLGNREALLRRLLAEGAADGFIERLVALLRVLLHFLLDIVVPLLAQLGDLFLDGQALVELVLHVLNTLLRLELAQFLAQFLLRNLGDVELGIVLEPVDEVPVGVAIQPAALGDGAGRGDTGSELGGVEVLGGLVGDLGVAQFRPAVGDVGRVKLCA